MHALTDLRLISGVMGAFVFAGKQGIIACDVPGVFKQDKLAQAGRAITRILGAGHTGFSDIKDMVLTFSEMVLLLRPLKGGVILVVMCDPDLNVNLLGMSLNLAQEDLDAIADMPSGSQSPVQDTPAGQVKAEAPAQQDEAVSVDALRADEELGPLLVEMEKALAKVVGPMASIIFDDSLYAWVEKGSPSVEEVGALVSIVSVEIADDGRAATYGKMVEELGA